MDSERLATGRSSLLLRGSQPRAATRIAAAENVGRFTWSCASPSPGTADRRWHHAQFKTDTGVQIYFCDPQAPWQRGTNENTNGLLRQYWPKGADLRVLTQTDCDDVALRLNTRPRKTLGWQTPGKAHNTRLVATAG